MQVWGNTCDVITVIVLWCHDSGPWHNISFLMTASNNNYQADVINNFHSNKAQFWKAHNKKISWASYGLYYSLEVTNHWINVLPLADVVGYIIKSKYRLGTPNLHWIMDMLQCILPHMAQRPLTIPFHSLNSRHAVYSLRLSDAYMRQ